MGRPTKAEAAAKKKAEALEKKNIADNKSIELSKKQSELNSKLEERSKKKLADKEKLNAQQNEAVEKHEEISNESISEVSNDAANNNSNDISNESVIESQSNTSVELSNQSNEAVSNIDADDKIEEVVDLEENNIPDAIQEYDIPDAIAKELEKALDEPTTSEDYQKPDDVFDPLKEKVIKRGYTDGKLGGDKQTSDDNGGDDNNGGSSDIPNIEPEISEPIIKDIRPDISNEGDDKGSSGASKIDKPKTPPVNPSLDDLSPTQKRKAAEKTADALITTYANLVPIPFIKISSFNMGKLENRHMNDEIDMNMAIMDDGTKIVDYCQGVNEQAEATFVITKQMQDEIREPLIDVLLENNFALTPTQRLIVAVGGQVVQMGIVAIEFMSKNSAAMDTFKKFHEENKALKVEVAQATAESNFSERVSVRREEKEVKRESAKESAKETVKEPDLRDNKKGDNIDIPDDEEESSNSGITVEEFLNEEK